MLMSFSLSLNFVDWEKFYSGIVGEQGKATCFFVLVLAEAMARNFFEIFL
jgi:hypothetical protein